MYKIVTYQKLQRVLGWPCPCGAELKCKVSPKKYHKEDDISLILHKWTSSQGLHSHVFIITKEIYWHKSFKHLN